MPLSKTIEFNNSGVNVAYWVVADIDFNLIAGTISARLNGYVSSAAFSGGKFPVDSRSFAAPTPGNFSTSTGAQIITAVQNFIKTQSEFTGATDAA